MKTPGSALPLRPSILDRLIDDEPRSATEPPGGGSVRLSQLKQAVKRDLEWLLNTKRTVGTPPDGMEHLATSPLTYGLPDITAVTLSSSADRTRLLRAIEEAIRRFEPRLLRVAVTMEPARELDRSVRFRIDGVLNVEPTPEAVTFDSMLQLPTRAFVVGGD